MSSTFAKSEDGTVQINLSIPSALIDKYQDEALAEMAKDVTVPGFRKGKAPKEKAREKISKSVMLEKALGKILPAAFADAITLHKINPSIYPKFEIISQGDNWQIRATTCEILSFDLPEYKKVVEGALRSASLKKELSKEEKEQIVLQALLENIKVIVPKILIDEEVNGRLSSLLERIEKLGLTLESYLGSIGKTADGIRKEYEDQVQKGIALEILLNKIADSEKVEVAEGEIDKTIATSAGDPKLAQRLNTPEQKRIIRSVLRRKRVLDSLVSTM